jgi:hypothetical protein
MNMWSSYDTILAYDGALSKPSGASAHLHYTSSSFIEDQMHSPRITPIVLPSTRHLFLGGGLGKVRKSLAALELGILDHACRIVSNRS